MVHQSGWGPALGQRHPERVEHELGAEAGAHRPSQRTGHAYDNALAESWADPLKTEPVADRVWRSRSQLELVVVEYIGRFNHVRLQSALGFVPPAEYELRWELSQFETLTAKTVTTAIEGRTADRWSLRSTVRIPRWHKTENS